MTLQELEQIMIKYGVAIKAIPEKTISIYEKNHLYEYPNGEVRYLEKYKREMLVVENKPKNAGKFVIVYDTGTDTNVWFVREFYNSIEEAVADLLKKKGV